MNVSMRRIPCATNFSPPAQRAQNQVCDLVEMFKAGSAHGMALESGEEVAEAEPAPEPKLRPEDERRIGELFTQAQADRSKAYELNKNSIV